MKCKKNTRLQQVPSPATLGIQGRVVQYLLVIDRSRRWSYGGPLVVFWSDVCSNQRLLDSALLCASQA